MFSCGALKKGAFDKMVADELGVKTEDILGKDLFLVNRQKGLVWGLKMNLFQVLNWMTYNVHSFH